MLLYIIILNSVRLVAHLAGGATKIIIWVNYMMMYYNSRRHEGGRAPQMMIIYVKAESPYIVRFGLD